MDRRYISETAPIFWSNLHRLKLNKGRVTINNIVDQIKRDFGIEVSRNEVLEVLFADEIKQNSRKGTLQTSPIVKPPSKRPKSAPYRKNPRTKRQVDKRIKPIQYRPVTPVYRASWTADKLVEMKNNRSSMYRKRTAHYNHVRRIRRPSLKPYPGGGSPKAPAFRI